MIINNIDIMVDFRFEQLDIWKESIEVSDKLFDYADEADKKRYFKFALRSLPCALSSEL